ncbi:choice-of-anchor Q domain-containing protein [Nocardioides immobilis]|uniref:choice-of-anchor Q domain-containing protein n=1 Tax=Nocardioides immobilis TaxID=2049295 RepID=UPI001C711B1F|nr:choice-of-anchor Q domain-containing protein [Nocardioides immobilis]
MREAVRRLSVGVATVALLPGLAITADAAGAAAAETVTHEVDALGDAVDADPRDGVCRTASGTCTLRAAVQETRASRGPDVIVLPRGRIELSRPLAWPLPSLVADLERDPSRGDLDLVGPVTVRGAAADATTIDGNAIDRVFSVGPRSNLTLSDVKITGGDATVADRTPADIAIGGAILNLGRLTVERVALVRNKADGGGGIFSTPFTTFTVRDSLIAFNTAAEGGGLRIDGGATIVNSTIAGNRLFERPFSQLIPDEITGYGGGIDHRGSGNVTIVSSTITGNTALKAGGGYTSGQGYAPIAPLTNVWPYRTTLLNTIVAGNTVGGRLDNCHVSSMVIESRGHNLADDGSCFLTGPGDRPGRAARLGALADNGGPTRTRMPLAGSPAIDAGATGGCPGADQRGVRRPRGTACDIGAVER